MFKKLLCLALLLTAVMVPSAQAAVYFRLNSKIWTGLRENIVNLGLERVQPSERGDLAVIDENGAVLAETSVRSGQKICSLSFRVVPDAPAMQTLRVVFRHNGKEEMQDECQLAVDNERHGGVYRGNPEEMKIALTFDAAYGAGWLNKLLDVLDRYHAPCTFFLQGDFVLEHPDLTLLIDEKGHEIGNHSMHHPDDFRELRDDKIYKEITECSETIQAVIGKPVTLVRPPAGYTSYRDRAISRALGCEVILWTFDSRDGFSDTSEDTIRRILYQKTVPGAIILMHIYGKYTVDILEDYLPMMQEKGYEFVTVSQMLSGGNVLTNP